MMTRAEKLFNIRAQVAKAMHLREHGDNWGTDGALGDAVIAIAIWLEEEVPEKAPPMLMGAAKGEQIVDIHPVGEEVKEPHPSRIKVKK